MTERTRAQGLVAGSPRAPGYRRIVLLLVWLVIVPSGLLLLVGMSMLVFYQLNLNVLFGILVVTLVGCAVTGIVLTLVFLRREADLARLQTDFVSKVSHELRTPLTSIRLFVDTLKMKRAATQDEMDACLAVLGTETQRLTDRIDRLLDWGRMEAGKMVYLKHPEQVDPLVRDVVAGFQSAHLGESIPIEVVTKGEVGAINVDRGAFSDALMNLLGNAVKYSGADRRIVVRCDRSGGSVRIAVTDNGVGIPHSEHRRIFDKFYRVDERLSRAAEGSGLGLAIVLHVVRAHNGSVVVDSEPGKGSTFTIVLPQDPPVGAQATVVE